MVHKMVVTPAKRIYQAVLLMSAFAFLMSGCSSNTQSLSDIQTQNANVELAQASATISHTLTDLGSLQRAATPSLAMKQLPDPNTYGMDAMASIDWSGPVEPVVREIANASRYQLKVFGSVPAVPVLVSVHQRNSTLGYILRDIDYQCASKANIVVYPLRHVIELRYARS